MWSLIMNYINVSIDCFNWLMNLISNLVNLLVTTNMYGLYCCEPHVILVYDNWIGLSGEIMLVKCI
jgi:hypothetical protein